MQLQVLGRVGFGALTVDERGRLEAALGELRASISQAAQLEQDYRRTGPSARALAPLSARLDELISQRGEIETEVAILTSNAGAGPRDLAAALVTVERLRAEAQALTAELRRGIRGGAAGFTARVALGVSAAVFAAGVVIYGVYKASGATPARRRRRRR